MDNTIVVYFMDDTHLIINNVTDFGWPARENTPTRVWVKIDGRMQFFNPSAVSFICWASDVFGPDFNDALPDSLEPLTV